MALRLCNWCAPATLNIHTVACDVCQQSKINDTKDVMKKKAMEIEKSKMESKKSSAFSPSSMTAFGSSMSKGPEPEAAPSFTRPEPPAPKATRAPVKGMQLGKAKKTNAFLETLAKEGEVVELEVPGAGSTGGAGHATVTANLSTDPLTLNIDEKLSVLLNKQGGLENLEVQGSMSLVVNNDADAFIRVAVASGANKQFQFKTHPNIDKSVYSSQNVLALKDPSRPFPTGSELGILKWRYQTKDESMVPLTINCWPSVSGGQSYVNIEYESTASFDLQNVSIVIPVPNGPPTVNQVRSSIICLPLCFDGFSVREHVCQMMSMWTSHLKMHSLPQLLVWCRSGCMCVHECLAQHMCAV